MGRAAGSSRSSSLASQQTSTSEFDPSFPPNLRRSLSRNDVELAALSKLHGALRSIKAAIIDEFGEEALLQCVVEEKGRLPVPTTREGGGESENAGSSGKGKDEVGENTDEKAEKKEQTNGNDEDGSDAGSDNGNDSDEDKENSSNQQPQNSDTHATDIKQPPKPTTRLQQLTTSFLLRMKLRRRLLNRLARRLHRVSHILDGGGSKISAPLPPLYGDMVRRYFSEESEASGLAVKILGGGEGSFAGPYDSGGGGESENAGSSGKGKDEVGENTNEKAEKKEQANGNDEDGSDAGSDNGNDSDNDKENSSNQKSQKNSDTDATDIKQSPKPTTRLQQLT
eukprot:CAMPEP_0183744734 /NCGR_PEP_ID=MMETSP0737-20130205/65882_1 /TAXON_ID=385413 /ORGANISM="Thalassiosira miniscula, Strain CCMP1093" /LENGTH=338 /DNA_ID=CAMNT_0025980385 /DNA_START=22 /DNA_END=1035 /DNA_ORIENTATION=+